ncbi:hypothetical protein BH09PSE5_BH09PSE5_04260 [soil metagenome]
MTRAINPAFRMRHFAFLAVAAVAACSTAPSRPPMSFFVTSTAPGNGANLGGLQGADQICQNLAASVGAGASRWRAYLSTTAVGSVPAVNARDRIGSGPWTNAKGEVIATSVADLHGTNKITKTTALSEKGTIINGRGDTPNQHDILTGSTPDGMSTPSTCNNWTSSTDGITIVGHSDKTGLDDSAAAKSWNSSHPTRNCSQPGLVATGGAGYLYCFATN